MAERAGRADGVGGGWIWLDLVGFGWIYPDTGGRLAVGWRVGVAGPKTTGRWERPRLADVPRTGARGWVRLDEVGFTWIWSDLVGFTTMRRTWVDRMDASVSVRHGPSERLCRTGMDAPKAPAISAGNRGGRVGFISPPVYPFLLLLATAPFRPFAPFRKFARAHANLEGIWATALSTGAVLSLRWPDGVPNKGKSFAVGPVAAPGGDLAFGARDRFPRQLSGTGSGDHPARGR